MIHYRNQNTHKPMHCKHDSRDCEVVGCKQDRDTNTVTICMNMKCLYIMHMGDINCIKILKISYHIRIVSFVCYDMFYMHDLRTSYYIRIK